MLCHVFWSQVEYKIIVLFIRFDQVLFLDVSFHRLNLTRGSSYLPLPDWLERKKAIINPLNIDEECFKWAVIEGLEWQNIKSHPEGVSNLRKCADKYDWSGLKFPMATKDIKVFEMNNNVSVNVLSVESKEIYICRKGIKRDLEVNLMLISDNGRIHYTAVKSLCRLLSSSNSKHKRKPRFCTNCL